VGGDAEVARGRGRTLVFAASVAAADAAAAALADAGLEPLLYHRGVPADERAAALDAMRSGCGPQGGVERLSAERQRALKPVDRAVAVMATSSLVLRCVQGVLLQAKTPVAWLWQGGRGAGGH